MAEWKKVIVSGSNAELNKLVVDTHVSASLFSGSFVGDGSGLTGLTAAAITSYTNASDNRIITSVDGTTVNSEENLTFDGSVLEITGRVNASSTITGSGLLVTGDASITGRTTLGDDSGDSVTINAANIEASNIPAGTDNTVLVLSATNLIVTDEIDPRVWGSTLISGSLTSGRVPYASDANTIQDSTNLTFNGTTLTANAVSVTNDLTVGGNLTINGDLTNINTTNLNIEDQFILLGSGSVSAVDAGIIFGGVTSATRGAAFFFDRETARLAYTAENVDTADTAVTPSGYVPVAYDVTGASHTPEGKVGNIKIEGGEAFIYV